MTTTDLISLEQVEDVLLHGGELAVISAEDVQADLVRRILESETVEQAFAGAKATPARELDGANIIVHGVSWMRSAFDEGPKVYAMLDVTTEGSDEHLAVSMGGRSLMASFLYAERNGGFPLAGTLREERSGQDPSKSFWTFKLA